MASPSLVVFGSQTVWPSPQYFSQLRETLLLEPSLHAFLTAIRTLPNVWESLVQSDPSLEAVPGTESLTGLKNWLDQGDFHAQPGSLPNVLCTPLTIIIHVVQYMHYVGDAKNPSHSQILESAKLGGVQGFCTGLLTAFAVACSKDEEDVARLGGVALRLALVAGAYVDLDGAYAKPANESCCIVVRWRAEMGKDRVLEILKAYPEAYISAVTDSNSVTITSSKASASSLSHELSSHHLTVKSIRLEGRFHSLAYRDVTKKVAELCDSYPALQFPDHIQLPVRSNLDAQIVQDDRFHQFAIQAMLLDLSNWHLVMSVAISQLIQTPHASILHVGIVECIPVSIARDSGLKVIKLATSKPLTDARSLFSSQMVPGLITPALLAPEESRYPEHAIAIVGMACKFPGADSPSEFWDLLSAGTSMLAQLPPERFSTESLRRSPENKVPFWGNYIRDADAFDNVFFRKTSRESASMDPQQRLLLQVAYEAIESSGYFGEFVSSTPPPEDIGCYLGVGATDYNDNVASHPPTAYSALGTLRAFLAGKLSHFFGWTGPSITFDTACSSSAVAIHSACKAIESGECSRALAGGASLFTSPFFFENLAAASFLSPTGATKPFDAKADGYCRGEGIGLVVLKKLSDAVAQGDNVMGVILGSAVNQSHNSTAITVPHSESQIKLYQKVNIRAGISPSQVSHVEAHGTGTPVGDPIEFESIRKVYGGARRSEAVHVASVKGNIGHLEGASGVAALIKTVLMIQKKKILPNASFSTLSPKISALEPDRMIIPTSTKDWNNNFRIGCINNYGASGNNAALIVCQPPDQRSSSSNQSKILKHPIFISAKSSTSFLAYCVALKRYVEQFSTVDSETALSNIAFNLATKHNHTLPLRLATTVSSLTELRDVLSTEISGSNARRMEAPKKAKPVVLAFGCQVRNFVGLSKEFYETSVVFAMNLDHCDSLLRTAGLKGLYPKIFESSPIDDVVNLHCQLFSLQYACARSWIDSGLKIDALVGHSFGQLTALCVSGCLSLEDGLKLVSGRASLMQKYWGPERGAMISIQSDLDTVLKIFYSVESLGADHKVEVACYNGPSSHVIVGSEASIKAVEDHLINGIVKFKRLNVTHGFHSELVEPLLPALAELAEELEFKDPVIPLETCTEHVSWAKPKPRLLAEHTRTPVHFDKAIGRISSRLGPCTWLEAGSDSSITSMIRKTLGVSSESDLFRSVSLQSASLADTTVDPWKAGHMVQFWMFHRVQSRVYNSMTLATYQFDKARHWLKWIDNVKEVVSVPPAAKVDTEPEMLSFLGYTDKSQSQAEFAVEPRSEAYKFYVKGHAVLAESLCPASLYVELVVQAATTLMGSSISTPMTPCVKALVIKSPLGLNDRTIALSMKRTEGQKSSWTFTLSSKPQDSQVVNSKGSQEHAIGRLSFGGDDMALSTDFMRYERLIGYDRCTGLISNPRAEALQGSLIYKVFSRVVSYKDYYRGVQSIHGKGSEVAGIVTLPSHSTDATRKTITHPLALDNFIQVSGLHVNCLNEMNDSEVYVCTKLDRIQLSPQFRASKATGHDAFDVNSWVIYSNFQPLSSKEVTNDVFVFDRASKSLVVIILGARFTKVPMTSLAKALSRVNASSPSPSITTPNSKVSKMPIHVVSEKEVSLTPIIQTRVDHIAPATQAIDFGGDLRDLLHRITDVPISSLTNESTIEDLGIDSLMVTEVIAELRKTFDVEISPEEFQSLPDVRSLSDCLRSKGCGASGDSTPNSMLESRDSNSTPASSVADDPPSDVGIIELASLVVNHLETTTTLSRETNLADQGLDSLSSIDLASEIKKTFDVDVDMSFISETSTFGELADMVIPQRSGSTDFAIVKGASKPFSGHSDFPASADSMSLSGAQQAFEQIRFDFDVFAQQTGFANFWKQAYTMQSKLVLAYVVEAFTALGCPLATLRPNQSLPSFQYLPKHSKVMGQYHRILGSEGIVLSRGTELVRSEKPIDSITASALFQEILQRYPQHTSEPKLLHSTGSRLADCLTGAADPIQIMFGNKQSRDLLTDVYTNAPMFDAITRLLGKFLGVALVHAPRGATYNILELGGGTGGTTKYIVDYLVRLNIPFTFTFTDISGSLVTTARKTFAGRDYMKFQTLDIEKSPPDSFIGHFHTIISSNCIHATKNLVVTGKNIRQMLRPDGFLALVELTRNIPWFDLVFGLLEGWWLFDDGRKHALANEWLWDSNLRSAGFKHVSWSDGSSDEARGLRVITAFAADAESSALRPQKAVERLSMETVIYKQVGQSSLCADISFPSGMIPSKRPVALMIHGGGHIMLSRKDVRPKQTQLLLDNGYLPVSIDYRLCPETTLLDGPMTDVCDALSWARSELPSLDLGRPELQINGGKVVAVGWSTGGHLAMTLAWTSRLQNMQPPEAILAFYCPTNYEDRCWKQSNFPENTASTAQQDYDLLEAVNDEPIRLPSPSSQTLTITAYNVPPTKHAVGGWMSPSDPRSRIALHMNWKGQALPVLLNGLPSVAQANSKSDGTDWKCLPMPPLEKIVAASPYAQVLHGSYRTPTFLVHGTADDLIPWRQSRDFCDELLGKGVRAGIAIPDGRRHLFDLYRDADGVRWAAVMAGYEFLFAHV